MNSSKTPSKHCKPGEVEALKLQTQVFSKQTCVPGPQNFPLHGGPPPTHPWPCLHALGAHFHIHMVNPSPSLSRLSKGPYCSLKKKPILGIQHESVHTGCFYLTPMWNNSPWTSMLLTTTTPYAEWRYSTIGPMCEKSQSVMPRQWAIVCNDKDAQYDRLQKHVSEACHHNNNNKLVGCVCLGRGPANMDREMSYGASWERNWEAPSAHHLVSCPVTHHSYR